MTGRKLAALVTLAVGALAYEVWALKDPVPGDTISEVTWWLSQFPVFLVAVGFLLGHFFWNSKTGKPRRKD